jgi:hypothetical protein
LAGTVLFLVGAVARGYLWGTLGKKFVGSNVELTAHIDTTTTCSEDEFDTYCRLMKP